MVNDIGRVMQDAADASLLAAGSMLELVDHWYMEGDRYRAWCECGWQAEATTPGLEMTLNAVRAHLPECPQQDADG